jgi:stage IV sporulation protein FB
MELGFRLFGLPVRVSLFFLLMGYVLRPADARDFPPLMLAWLVVMFAGVLVHELGHALTARRFGQEPAILLHGWGGVTYWTPRGEVGAGRRLLISAAGPAIGVALGLVLLLVRDAATFPGSTLHTVLGFAVRVNLGWGLFNLVPLLPLDGGQVFASFLEMLGVRNGRRAVHIFSLVVCVALGVLAAITFNILGVVVAGVFAYVNYTGLRPPPRPLPEPPPVPPTSADPRF